MKRYLSPEQIDCLPQTIKTSKSSPWLQLAVSSLPEELQSAVHFPRHWRGELGRTAGGAGRRGLLAWPDIVTAGLHKMVSIPRILADPACPWTPSSQPAPGMERASSWEHTSYYMYPPSLALHLWSVLSVTLAKDLPSSGDTTVLTTPGYPP